MREDLRRRHIKRHDKKNKFPQAISKGYPPQPIGSTSSHDYDSSPQDHAQSHSSMSPQVDPLLTGGGSTTEATSASSIPPLQSNIPSNNTNNLTNENSHSSSILSGPQYRYSVSNPYHAAYDGAASAASSSSSSPYANLIQPPPAALGYMYSAMTTHGPLLPHPIAPHLPTSDLRMNSNPGSYPMSVPGYGSTSSSVALGPATAGASSSTSSSAGAVATTTAPSASASASYYPYHQPPPPHHLQSTNSPSNPAASLHQSPSNGSTQGSVSTHSVSNYASVSTTHSASTPSTSTTTTTNGTQSHATPNNNKPNGSSQQAPPSFPYLNNGTGSQLEPITPAQFPAVMPPDEFTSWLFSDTVLNSTESTFTPFESPISLHSLVSPPLQNEQLSDNKKDELLRQIPLDSMDSATMEKYLDAYWKMFHTQFPIIHRPSFDAESAEPGLLWAILLVGAASTDDRQGKLTAERIAEPLRWLLFGHKDFSPPAMLWVIQALLLLELYEKCMSKRRFHERAYIHHGTLLQLIRRGSALKGEYHHRLHDTQDLDPWQKWITTESAKRAVLMAFCLDVFDAALFGHPMIMSVHEVRVNLPCDEDLWEAYPKDRSKKLPQAESFLIALKKTLNRQHVKTGPFGRRILLSGLLCISLQMQQGELQANTVGWPAGMGPLSFRKWREHIVPALEWWHYDGKIRELAGFKIPPEIRNNSGQGNNVANGCHWPVYHVAYIIMLVCPLEINKHAGCPQSLNHKVSKEEQEASSQRVHEALTGPYGSRAIWHAIQLLNEMFTQPSDPESQVCGCSVACIVDESCNSKVPDDKTMVNATYKAPQDPIIKRPQMVYLCALVLWSYVYGQDKHCETHVMETLERANDARLIHALSEESDADTFDAAIRFYEPEESGYDYLRRMATYTPQQLENAPNKHNIIGLLRLVSDSLNHHHWELITEGRRLLNFCIYRSMGGSQTSCRFMIKRQSG